MRDARQDTLSTYRHLRLAMVFVLALLLVAVAQTALTAAPGLCFEGSISAYYFTSARAVFIGALCALGAGLIVYRGNTDLEDVALNISGALAFVVAFVPTLVPSDMGVRCSASNVPTADQLDRAVNSNMVAYFVVAVPTLIIATVLTRRSPMASRTLWAGQALMAFGLGVGIVCFALWPEGFRDQAHSAAAILTFVGILVVVGLNAWGAMVARPLTGGARYGTAYIAIAALMFVSFVVIGGIHLALSDWRHGVLVIEATLLLEFLAFWLVQTVELWRDTTRPLPPDAPPALAA